MYVVCCHLEWYKVAYEHFYIVLTVAKYEIHSKVDQFYYVFF